MDLTELYNEDAEQSILGIMMVDNHKASSISYLLDVSDFFTEGNRLLFSSIVELVSKDKPADIVSVSEKLKFENHLEEVGGRDYINLLASNVIITANYKQLCKIIIKYSKKRKLIYLLDKTKEQLEKGEDIDNAIEHIKTQSELLMLNKTDNNMTSILAGVTEVMDEIDTVLNSETKTFGLSTGFKKIDNVLSGLCKSKLYILGARSRVGKSALAQQIAENVSVNHNVLFHSLEMKSAQYTKRSVFRLTGLNNDILTNGGVTAEDAMARVAQASEQLSKLNLFIDDSSECNLTSIEKNINKMIDKKGSCDLVVVDYLQLMGSNNKKVHDRFEIVSNNSRGMKRLANKYNVPILCLCQLSRQLEQRQDKRPILSDLRDSGDIEQDADVVMFLYRDELYTTNPMSRGKAELIIAKNREGTCRMIPMLFNGSKTQFLEGSN